MVDPYDIILMPWITEKTLEARRVADEESGYRENNNRIEFIVRREATKKEIREAVEQMFDVKVQGQHENHNHRQARQRSSCRRLRRRGGRAQAGRVLMRCEDG